jgi:hypothetical protein
MKQLRITQGELSALQIVTDHLIFTVQGGLKFDTKEEYLRYVSYIAILYSCWALPILIQLYTVDNKPIKEQKEGKGDFEPQAVERMIEELEERIRKAIGEEWQNPSAEKYKENILTDLRRGLMHIARPTAKGE